MNRRLVVRLIDQDGQFMVGQRHILDGGGLFGTLNPAGSVAVGHSLSWWWREVNDWWFFGRVDNRSSIFDLGSGC